jgi:hypothetical protein
MTFVVRFLITTLLITNLTSCAVAYRHPNYEFNSREDQLNFDKDRQACEPLSARQNCVELKEKALMICESNGTGGHECREVAPTQCTVVTREQCLRSKGWRKADVNGNYLE